MVVIERKEVVKLLKKSENKKRLAESLQQAYPYHPKQNTKEQILSIMFQ